MTKEQKILKTELNEAIWVGEDGNAAAFCKTKLGAFRKFKKLMREDCGEIEASEMKIEDVEIGWLHYCGNLSVDVKLAKGLESDTEWYVSWSVDEKSPYEVWIYRIW